MTRFSALSLFANALSSHKKWPQHWPDAAPKQSYDAIIVGAGGHGLGAAYYLASRYGITNVAVIEKGWLGGGNTGRNTTIIRSNYLYDESAHLYDHAVKLWDGLSQDLNFNVMYSKRGVMMLAHNVHDVQSFKRHIHANRLNGVDNEWLTPEEAKAYCPPLSIAPDARYPVLVGPALGGPLFFAHYSYLGFDPRHKKDAFCNYFVRNRNHALIHYQHCIANPENHAGSSAVSRGLTASDDPWGYSAHDPYPTNDNGTITPTAALASMPYTPQESLAALRHFYRSQGERLWGPYGFYDAFNLDQDWYASSYLAIDQGPVVAMIENARTGLLWNYFMQNEEIQPALDAAGFQEDLTGTEENDLTKTGFNILVYPNPLTPDGQLALEISILEKQVYTARLIDEQGRIQRVLFRNRELGAGIFQEKFDLKNPGRGTYFLEIENGKNEKQTTKIIVSGG